MNHEGQPISNTLPAGTVKTCAVCQTAVAVELLYHTPGFDVVTCRQCDFAYVNERIVEMEKGEGIPELLAATCLLEEESFLRRFRRNLDRIEELEPDKGKILDVGCGEGYFLYVARESGWDVYGIDLDHCRVKAAAQYGLQVEWNTLEKAELRCEQFDVVTLFNVIEHLNKPVESLEKIGHALRPNGLLLLETTANDFPLIRLMTLLYRLSGGRLYQPVTYFYTYEGLWGHQYRHCRKSLTTLMERTGFEVLKVGAAENPPFSLSLKQRNYGKTGLYRLINFVKFAPVFLAVKVPGMNIRTVAYGRKKN